MCPEICPEICENFCPEIFFGCAQARCSSPAYKQWLSELLVSELASEDRELTRQHLAAERLRLLMLSENHLPQYRPLTDQQILRKDELSTRLLQSQNPLILDTYVPIFTTADGNCLFRAVSMLCYGTEDHHELLRLLCACEVILHPHMYNRDSSFLYEPFRNAKYLSVPSMDNVIDELLRHGR